MNEDMNTGTASTDTYLVTGGTGRTGHRVVTRLRERGLPVRVASRRGIPPFDWHDSGTWPAALEGTTVVYLCVSPDLALPGVDDIVAEFTRVAVESGVRRLVLLSGRGEDGARACEDLVRASGIDGVVVRSSWFAQNFSEHFLLGQVLRGRVALPVDGVREPFVDLDDVADVAVRALTDPALTGRVLEVTGPDAIGFARAAELLSLATGRPVDFETVTSAEFVADLTGEGVPAGDAEGLAWLFAEVLDGRNEAVTDTVEEVLGRAPRTFADYASRAAAAGAWRLTDREGEVAR